ncbi:MAG: hypothetical protein JXR03_10455 [Cyclobacteriaceae bacterium]
MKKIILLVLVFIISQEVFAQGLMAKTYVEKTQVGLKHGTALGVLFPNKIEVGAFYQEHAGYAESNENMPRIYEKSFAGMYLSYPLKSAKRVGLDLNIRTGAVNGDYFSITPSLLGYYRPIKLITIGGGVGIRSFSMTLQSSISINLTGGR